VSAPFPEAFQSEKCWICSPLRTILDCLNQQTRTVLEASGLELSIVLAQSHTIYRSLFLITGCMLTWKAHFPVLFHLGLPLFGGSVNGCGNPPFHLLYIVMISA